MEYGDLSSLVVEYPDYNSMGSKILKIAEYQYKAQTNLPVKIQETFTLPDIKFGDLAGRAVIVTHKNGDLIAYGLIVNESTSL